MQGAKWKDPVPKVQQSGTVPPPWLSAMTTLSL